MTTPTRRIWAVALALLAAAPAAARAQADDEIVRRLSAADLEELLDGMGLEPQRMNGDNVGFRTTMSGLRVGVFLEGNGSNLQLLTFLSGTQPSEEDVNRFNARKRFARAYLNDGEPVLQQDLDLAEGVTRANVREAIELFRLLVQDFKEAF
jgi:hypothetical protein